LSHRFFRLFLATMSDQSAVALTEARAEHEYLAPYQRRETRSMKS
jgi:hypothetical protein